MLFQSNMKQKFKKKNTIVIVYVCVGQVLLGMGNLCLSVVLYTKWDAIKEK